MLLCVALLHLDLIPHSRDASLQIYVISQGEDEGHRPCAEWHRAPHLKEVKDESSISLNDFLVGFCCVLYFCWANSRRILSDSRTFGGIIGFLNKRKKRKHRVRRGADMV